MHRFTSIFLFFTLTILLAQTTVPPLPFPEYEKNITSSENSSVNKDIPYSVRSFFYKEGLNDAIQELNSVLTKDSEIGSDLITMIIGVVASRNRCLY